MAGSVRTNPARIVLPASAMVLAGMAWRVGWISEPALVAVALCVVVPVAVFLGVMAVSIPILMAVAVLGSLVHALRRLGRGKGGSAGAGAQAGDHHQSYSPAPDPIAVPRRGASGAGDWA